MTPYRDQNGALEAEIERLKEQLAFYESTSKTSKYLWNAYQSFKIMLILVGVLAIFCASMFICIVGNKLYEISIADKPQAETIFSLLHGADIELKEENHLNSVLIGHCEEGLFLSEKSVYDLYRYHPHVYIATYFLDE